MRHTTCHVYVLSSLYFYTIIYNNRISSFYVKNKTIVGYKIEKFPNMFSYALYIMNDFDTLAKLYVYGFADLAKMSDETLKRVANCYNNTELLKREMCRRFGENCLAPFLEIEDIKELSKNDKISLFKSAGISLLERMAVAGLILPHEYNYKFPTPENELDVLINWYMFEKTKSNYYLENAKLSRLSHESLCKICQISGTYPHYLLMSELRNKDIPILTPMSKRELLDYDEYFKKTIYDFTELVAKYFNIFDIDYINNNLDVHNVDISQMLRLSETYYGKLGINHLLENIKKATLSVIKVIKLRIVREKISGKGLIQFIKSTNLSYVDNVDMDENYIYSFIDGKLSFESLKTLEELRKIWQNRRTVPISSRDFDTYECEFIEIESNEHL